MLILLKLLLLLLLLLQCDRDGYAMLELPLLHLHVHSAGVKGVTSANHAREAQQASEMDICHDGKGGCIHV